MYCTYWRKRLPTAISQRCCGIRVWANTRYSSRMVDWNCDMWFGGEQFEVTHT